MSLCQDRINSAHSCQVLSHTQEKLTKFTNFGLERLRVAVEHHFYGFVAFVLVLQRVEAVDAVAVVTERAHGKTITISS